MDLVAQIDRWGREIPERIAHRSGERTLTYGELLAQSDALAAWFAAELGDDLAPIDDRGHKDPEMLVAFLGVVKSGRPYVPIDIAIPEQRAERIAQTAAAALVLTPARVAEICTPAVSDDRSGCPPFNTNGLRRQPEDPFYILFTSGSTGEPKGVVITHANLAAFVHWMLGEQGFSEGETFLNQAPFSFDLSVMDLYLSLVTGGTLFSISKDEIASLKLLYGALARSGVTTWVSTPSFAQMCLIERTFAEAMIPSLRRFLFCGEALAPETAAQLLDRFPQAEVWNTYGPTEATVATTSVRVDRALIEKWSPLPVGYEMPGTCVCILDENRCRVPAGERGEIVIAGPNVSPGYLGREDLTARAFYDTEDTRAYRTGDWGRERDGLIFFEGRMDSQVKVNGYRIELGDLEANLRALPEIADAVVLPVEKAGRIDSLAAFVVLAGERSGSDFEISARLKTRLAERVPAYMFPRKFHFLDAFPMTANGKADRRALAERVRA